MFEITKADDISVEIDTKGVKVVFDLNEETIDAGLAVGKIHGPGEFEIGDLTIRGIAVGGKKSGEDGKKADEKAEAVPAGVRRTIYSVEVGGVHVGIIGDCEDGLDDLGLAEILCTSSVRAVRELEPKLVVSMGNIDGMVSDLKLTARTEKKLKVKNLESLPVALEVVAIN